MRPWAASELGLRMKLLGGYLKYSFSYMAIATWPVRCLLPLSRCSIELFSIIHFHMWRSLSICSAEPPDSIVLSFAPADPCTVRCDNSVRIWRDKGFLDAIVADPP